MSAITEDMRRFILINIPSIPYLEALLLLHGDPSQQLNVEQVAKRLFINVKIASAILQQLQLAGVIENVNKDPNLYQYHPRSEELKKILDELAKIYLTDLIEVTNLVHSNTNKKAQKFANAFLWRKDR